ncbi:MAG: helix-turn-helix transcriptional regulator [Methylocystaceae bacterium]|nr:helix-turn-helix transcriptional regulator [Methylocystaceae bacterium]
MEIRSTFNSTKSYKQHYHNQLSLGLITSGSTCLKLKEGDILLKQGDMVLIDPLKPHACAPIEQKPRSYYMIYINTDWCLQKMSGLKNTSVSLDCSPYVIQNPSLFDTFVRLMQNNSDVLSELEQLIEATLLLYTNLPSKLNDKNTRAVSIRNHLLADFENIPSLEELAQQHGCSIENIIRLFKKDFGLSPRAYLNSARVEKGKKLLKKGNSIVDVALDLGFADQSQFHHTFVKYTASTPRQYQKSIFDNNS